MGTGSGSRRVFLTNLVGVVLHASCKLFTISDQFVWFLSSPLQTGTEYHEKVTSAKKQTQLHRCSRECSKPSSFPDPKWKKNICGCQYLYLLCQCTRYVPVADDRFSLDFPLMEKSKRQSFTWRAFGIITSKKFWHTTSTDMQPSFLAKFLIAIN